MKQKHKVTAESDRLVRVKELLRGLENELADALACATAAATDEERDRVLLRAGELRLHVYAFATALAAMTGEHSYRCTWDFHRRLSEPLQKRWDRIKHAIRRSPLPSEALDILKELRASMPPPKIFEGEAEYRQWLKRHNMCEVDPDDYQSQTRGRTRIASL